MLEVNQHPLRKPRNRTAVGHRYGRLTVESRGDKHGKLATWNCRCDCGNLKTDIASKYLQNGSIKSCGCLMQDIRERSKRNAGLASLYPKEYRAWVNAKARCSNPNHSRYKDWGGRGIRVCAEWQKDFAAFFNHIGPIPPGMKNPSIGRIDNDKGYEPGNVGWQTAKQQARNRRNNVIIAIDGEFMCATDWAEKLDVPASTLLGALRAGGTIDKFTTCPLPQPEFNLDGTANLKNPEIRKRIAETVEMLVDLDEPRVHVIADVAEILDLSCEQTRRILRGVNIPTEPAAERLAEFLMDNLRPKKVQAAA